MVVRTQPKHLVTLAIATAIVWLMGGKTSASEPGRERVPVTEKRFGVSDSVFAFCSAQPAPMCAGFKQLLAELLSEPRDERWARPMELQIARFMRTAGDDRVEMRALECRRSLCALEYAVAIDELEFHVDGDHELERMMEMVGGVSAPELSGTGGVIVSVLIWRKRI